MVRNHTSQKGFSLLELLLAIGLFVMVLLAVFNILQSFAERELARSTNKYMTTVAEATRQILSNISSFNALYDAARATGGGYQLIADSTAGAADNIASPTGRFVIGGVTIQASRLLNSQFSQTSPLRSQIRVLLRIADDPTTEADTRALEVMVVTRTPRPDGLVRLAASEAGPSGGWVRTYTGKNTAVMQNAFGSWRVTPSVGLQATNWYTADLQGNLVSETDGSYLVNYSYVNREDKISDYLYRREDTDNAGRRNTMNGPLNLGGNDIIGADDVNVGNGGSAVPFVTADVVSDSCAGDVLCVNGTGIIKGAATIGGTMVVDGSALVANSMNAQTMRVQNGLTSAQRTAYGAQGLMVVDGTNGTQDTVQVGGNATFNDGVTSGTGTIGNITAATTTVADGGTFVTNTITNTRRITSTTTSAGSLSVDHQLKAGIVSSGNINVTGRTGTIDIRNSNNLVYGTNASPRTLVAPKINVNNLSISNFGTCNTGCGQ